MKPLRSARLLGGYFLILSLVPVGVAHAAPGDLDTTFAGTGKSRIGFGFGNDFGRAVAVQADGKLIVAGFGGGSTGGGNFAVVRFDTNNLLDASFGDGGKVLTPIGSPDSAQASAAGIQADGKIVVAGSDVNGTNYSVFALARYNTNGTLDSSFGTNGIAFTDFGQGAQGNALVIQADGKIVVAGGRLLGGGSDFALARFETNGMLDTSFAGGGTVITDANGDAAAYGVTLQRDGKIVAAGTGGFAIAVLRYNTNGLLDTTFGGGTGKVFTQIGGSDSANAVRMQFGNTFLDPDKIVVAGYTEVSFARYAFAVVRYTLDGSLDPSFGNGGIVTNSVGSGPGFGDFGEALVVQGTGTLNRPRLITVVGYNETGCNEAFALARYTAAGALDSTFGNGTGKVLLSFGAGGDDVAYAAAVQAGRIVVAGSSALNRNSTAFAVARLNFGGSLDTSFGSSGIVTAYASDRPAQAKAVAVQSDRKMIVAGSADNGVSDIFALARINPDGSLDASFGVYGKVTTAVGVRFDEANAVGIQADGRIVVAGSANNGADQDFAIVRFDTNGSLDTSFGAGGIVTTPIGSGEDVANAVHIQADGKIVVAGSSYNGANDDFAVVRYNPDGSLDTSFGVNGKVTTAIANGEDQAFAVQIQSDGKIVVAGYSVVVTSADFALARYTPNGVLDNSFGSFGRVVTHFNSGSSDIGSSMALQPNGRILVGGWSAAGPVTFALARYNTNGSLDSSFNGDGKVTTPLGIGNDFGSAIALQPDGKIVMAGYNYIGASPVFAAVRYNVDGSLDGSYGTGGTVLVDVADAGDDFAYALAVDPIGRAVIVGDAGGKFGVVRLAGDPFLKILSITSLANGHVGLQGLGIPNGDHTLLGSTNLVPGSFGALAAVTADAGGFWQYEDAGAGSLRNRFYRFSFP